MMLDKILEQYPEGDFVVFHGFDEAVIGIDPYKMTLVYSIEKCLELLVEIHEMTPDQALEYFDYNVAGTLLGEGTPIWFDDLEY